MQQTSWKHNTAKVKTYNLTYSQLTLCYVPLLEGVSIHWLGDFVFVESGLGVRVKFDLANTVYLTVTAEHLAATRGLCGVYNNNADGEGSATWYASSRMIQSLLLCLSSMNQDSDWKLNSCSCGLRPMLIHTTFSLQNCAHYCGSVYVQTLFLCQCNLFISSVIDDFTTMGGTISQYAASFGNSWKVPDEQNEVLHYNIWLPFATWWLFVTAVIFLYETLDFCDLWIHTESNQKCTCLPQIPH